jgi:hypothetical protein
MILIISILYYIRQYLYEYTLSKFNLDDKNYMQHILGRENTLHV